jgi:nucleoporin NUP42
MTKDLTVQVDKPLWPLSSYGPSKHEVNLISNLDESPDELRVRAAAAIKAGAISDYVGRFPAFFNLFKKLIKDT